MKPRVLRVLLVEDDEDDYVIIRDLLSETEWRQFTLDWASTYAGAVETARQAEYDVYLIDYRLGERNGLELMRELHLDGCRSPIILLTGQGDHDVDLKAMQAGAADYLEKAHINSHLLERSIRYAVEHARTLQALGESEERFRGIFLGAAIGIALVDSVGRIVGCNPALRKMLGYSEEDLCSMSFDTLLHPDRVNDNRNLYQELASGKRQHYQLESQCIHKHGHCLWIRLTVSPLHDTEGSGHLTIHMVEDITRRKDAEKALRESEKQLRVLSTKLLEAQETERKFIAQELHDSVGANLSAIIYSLEETLSSGPAIQSGQLEDVISMVRNTVEESRRICANLRPPILDDLGILATVRWLCREFQRLYSGIRIETRIELEENEVAEPLKIVIYRVLQECLNNIAKHSEADFVAISLRKEGHRLELSVQDNGRGFDMQGVVPRQDVRGGMGLASMKERTELGGGSLMISSTKGTGTLVRAIWPCK
ncbi:MAG: PAS domain S-box protein [Syntrophobacteria bacterium]